MEIQTFTYIQTTQESEWSPIEFEVIERWERMAELRPQLPF